MEEDIKNNMEENIGEDINANAEDMEEDILGNEDIEEEIEGGSWVEPDYLA